MTYCNWCMLESDTDDVCIWCKRPLKMRGVYSQARNDLHYLKETDDVGGEGFPIAAMLGGAAFLAIVVFAVIAYMRPSQAASAQNESHWVLDSSGKSRVPVSSYSVGTGSAFGLAPTPQAPAYSPPPSYSAPPSHAQDPPADATSAGSQVALNVRSVVTEDATASSSVYFESADFKFVDDRRGIPRLVGDIVVVNDSLNNLENGQLWIVVNNSTYPLLRYDGKVTAPRVLPSFSLASKSSLPCHVYAKDFDTKSKAQGKRSLVLAGFILSQPVKVQADLTGK